MVPAIIKTQRPHSRQGRESAGRFASRFEAIYSPLSIVAGTVRLSWREVGAHNFGPPTLDRFPQFSSIARKWPLIGLQVTPKTAEIDQTWPFFLLPSSAVALLHYPQPSTRHSWSLDLSPQAKHRDARPRAVGAWERGGVGTAPACLQPKVARLRCFAFGA